jgi:hypothetical protein
LHLTRSLTLPRTAALFEIFRDLLEQDIRTKEHTLVQRALDARRISIAHYLTIIVSALLAFLVLLTTECMTRDLTDPVRTMLFVGGLSLAALLLLSGQIAASERPYLSAIAGTAARLTRYFSVLRAKDFLAHFYWWSIATLWTPFFFAAGVLLLRHAPWVTPGSAAFVAQKDVLTGLAGFTGALLGAQLTLFTFIFGNFIGRYSSSLARAVVTHRTVKSVVLFACVLFGSVVFSLLFGYPESFWVWPYVVAALSGLCLFLTVLIALAGIATEGAILYVGHHFAQRVRRDTKPPWGEPSGSGPKQMWAFLQMAGLDFRHPERLSGFSPPTRGSQRAGLALLGLSNAASRALQDGQPEPFRACVAGMVEIVRAWTQARELYKASDDPVFRFLNNHFAIVIRRAARAPDESLVREAVLGCGLLARLSLLIGRRPEFENGRPRSDTVPEPTPLWTGLLTEAFLQTHSLMRSTAASEALIQLKQTALGGLYIGFYGAATLSYAPEVEKLHRVCLASPDVYHLQLAAEALRDVAYVWWAAVVFPGGTRLDYEIEPTFSATLKRMAAAQIELNDMPSLLFNDAVTSLTVKLATDRVILQDLVGAILAQPRRHAWEEGASVSEIVSVVGLVTESASKAIKRRQPLAKNWGVALFEIGYLVLRGKGFGGREDARVVKALFGSWRELLGNFETQQHVPGWQHAMFGLLGYGFGVCKGRPSTALKSELERSVQACIRLAPRAEEASSWADEERMRYVQLAGAWSTWVGLDSVATDCADLVASVSAPSSGIGWSEARYGRLGYPTIMHADFFLPNLPNVRMHVTDEEGRHFESIQRQLISDEVLLPFAREIEEKRTRAGDKGPPENEGDNDSGDL